MTKDQHYWTLVDSPLGILRITERNGLITELNWAVDAEGPSEAPTPLLAEVATQLDAYFEDRLRVFDLPLHAQGTPFQERVWEAIARIPHGSVKQYGDLARECGSAARAVGNACGRNPIPIIIPCHRVVAASGRTGGYSGHLGPDTKLRLLTLERAVLM